LEIRKLIRQMSVVNPLWGAPRIHGELLKIGIDVGQTSVAKYMVRRRGPPALSGRTFLRNPAVMPPYVRQDQYICLNCWPTYHLVSISPLQRHFQLHEIDADDYAHILAHSEVKDPTY